MNVSTLDVAANLDVSGIKAGAEEGKKIISGLVGAFIDLGKTAISPLGMVTSAVSGMVDTLGKVGLAAMGLKAVGTTAFGIVSGLTAGNAALEMTTISFTTLLGSASAANDMIKQLTTFAANTPFNLPGLESATQRLLGAGYTAKEIVPMMTALGDSIAALGGTQDQLNSLVYVMGQMRNEAHLNAGDIMQMSNLGIPALQMLADHYGKTTSEIQEMISKGLIPGTEAAKIFQEGMEKRYGGMMAAQSQTFSGMISNLQDWATQTINILTKPFFEPAKKGLATFLSFVQSPAGVAAINKLAGYIQQGVDKATVAFTKAIPIVEQFWHKIEPVVLTLWKFHEAISPLGIAIDVFRGYLDGGVTGALDAFKTRFELIGGYVKRGLDLAMEAARKYGPALLAWVSDTAIMLAGKLVVWGEALIGWIAPYAVRLINELINLGGRVLNWIADHARLITSQVFAWAVAIVSWIAPAVPRVVDALIELGGRVLNWVVGYAPVLAEQVLVWAKSIVAWVLPAIPQLLSALTQFGVGLITWISQEAPILTNMLLAWTGVLASWILPAIPGIIANLAQVGKAVLNWGLTTLPNLIGQFVIGIGRGLGVNLTGPVNDILLIFNSLVGNIRSTVLPAFMEMVGYLETTGLPLFNRLSAFIAGTVIPTIASLAAFAMNVLVPAFVTAADIFGRVFGPSLTLIGSIVRDELLPTLSGLWETFEQKYLPTVQSLATAFGQHLAGGIELVVSKFKESLPHVEAFYKKIEPYAKTIWDIYNAFSPLSIALDVFKGFLTGGVQGGLDAFKGRMDKIGDIFKDIVPKILTGLSEALPTIFDWIGEQAPKILDQLGKWGDSFGQLMDKVLPPLFNALLTIGDKVLTWIVDAAPGILDKLGEWAGKFGEFAKKAIPILIDKLGDLINALFKWLGDKAPDILSALGEWTGKFVEWGAGLFKKIYPEFVKLMGKIWDWLGEKAPEIANKLGDWAGAFLQWVVTDFIPGWAGMAWKIETTILKFIGEMILKIAGALLGWAGEFLGWVAGVVISLPGKLWDVASVVRNWIFDRAIDVGKWFLEWVPKILGFVGDVVTGLPGALWNIIVGIGNWVLSVAGNIAGVAWDIGSGIINGIINAVQSAPGRIWNAITGVLGTGAVDIIKGVVKTVANFFVDVVNTPINAMNGIIGILKGIDILGAKPFDWLPTIPKLGYVSFAQGTENAPGGLAMVGDNKYGPELVTTGGKQYIVEAPTLTYLNPGDKVKPLGSGSNNGGSGKGDVYYITIPLTIYGNPDDLQVSQFKEMAEGIVEGALASKGVDTANVRAFGR